MNRACQKMNIHACMVQTFELDPFLYLPGGMSMEADGIKSANGRNNGLDWPG